MGVFDVFAQSASAEIALPELSAKTKGDEKLLCMLRFHLTISINRRYRNSTNRIDRIMRFLYAQNIFEDIGTETPTYKASPIALALANGTTSGETFKHV